MQHHVGAAQSVFDGKCVGDVPDDELGVVGKIGRTLTIAAVNLGREIVEQADLVAGRKEDIGSMGADEARASSDQYPRHSPLRAP